MANERSSDLPDITGICDIDDSRIPTQIISKPPEPKKTGKQAESILIPDKNKKRQTSFGRNPAAGAGRVTSRPAERKTESSTRKQKIEPMQILRSRMLLVVAGVVLLALLIAVIAVLHSIKNRPVVVTAPVERGNFSDTYEANAIIYTETTQQEEARTYAVFVDNRYDRESSPLKTGQPAEIRISDDVTVTGRLAYIRQNEETDSAIVSLLMSLLPGTDFEPSGNTVIMIHLDDADAAPENAAVKVSITVNEQDGVLLVPVSAVQDKTGEPYVWAYKSFGKKLVKTPVTLGPEADGKVVVTSGLSSGTPIVIEGITEDLADGMKVNAQEQAGETQAQ